MFASITKIETDNGVVVDFQGNGMTAITEKASGLRVELDEGQTADLFVILNSYVFPEYKEV